MLVCELRMYVMCIYFLFEAHRQSLTFSIFDSTLFDLFVAKQVRKLHPKGDFLQVVIQRAYDMLDLHLFDSCTSLYGLQLYTSARTCIIHFDAQRN